MMGFKKYLVEAKVFININGKGKYFSKDDADKYEDDISTEYISSKDKTFVRVGPYEFNVDGEYEDSDVEID